MNIVTRREAVALGLRTYFTGRPCKNGHIDERLTGGRVCLSCKRDFGRQTYKNRAARNPDWAAAKVASIREWKQANPDRVKAAQHLANQRAYAATDASVRRQRHKEWRDQNREHLKEKSRRWREANAEKANAMIRQWTERNPEMVRAARHKRRATVASRGHITADQIKALIRRQRGRCANCGERSSKLQLDHIQPIARNGENTIANAQMLCGACNRRKAARDPIAWAQSNGRLL